MEKGSWELENDTLLEVGTVNTNSVASTGWKNIDFENSFVDDPLVFSQVQTDNGNDFVRTRQKNVSIDGFELTMEEEDAQRFTGHAQEKLGWLAISSGSGNWSQNSYQAGKTDDEITHNWHEIQWNQDFSKSPIFLASIASYDGKDPSGLRYNELSDNQVSIRIEEDISRDRETSHTTETVNFFAISGSNSLRASNAGEVDQNLLFKSGFEGDIAITPIDASKHTITGTDRETNFSWDSDLPAKKAQFLYLTGGESPEPYVENRIEKVVGADGKPTNALYMEVKKDRSGDNFITRNEFQLFPSPDLEKGYISYSMKLQGNDIDAWPNKDAWRVFMEWKEPGIENSSGGTNNYRFNLSINADREQIHWSGKTQQVQPSRFNEWSADNKQVSVPLDEWFDVEVFWRKGDEDEGRLWFAVNGEEVFDFRGRTQHADRPQDLEFWSIFKLYTGRDSLQNGSVYQWIDDVEIHSDFPNK